MFDEKKLQFIETHFGTARLLGWDFVANYDFEHRLTVTANKLTGSADQQTLSAAESWLTKHTTSDIIFCELGFALSDHRRFYFSFHLKHNEVDKNPHTTPEERIEIIRQLLSINDQRLGQIMQGVRAVLKDTSTSDEPSRLHLALPEELYDPKNILTVYEKNGRQPVAFEDIRSASIAQKLTPQVGQRPVYENQPKPHFVEGIFLPDSENGRRFAQWYTLTVAEPIIDDNNTTLYSPSKQGYDKALAVFKPRENSIIPHPITSGASPRTEKLPGAYFAGAYADRSPITPPFSFRARRGLIAANNY